MAYIKELVDYIPFNEQEAKDKELMLNFINNFDNVLLRDNEFGHFTASAFVVNEKHDKILMVYHNIYKSWSWIGGHVDGDADFLDVAYKELKEETGVQHIKTLTDKIFSIEIIPVYGHIKNNHYVASHLHLNVTYLFEVDENDPLFIKQDENSGVSWIKIDEINKYSSEQWMIENIYNKLIQKLHDKI